MTTFLPSRGEYFETITCFDKKSEAKAMIKHIDNVLNGFGSTKDIGYEFVDCFRVIDGNDGECILQYDEYQAKRLILSTGLDEPITLSCMKAFVLGATSRLVQNSLD